MHPRTKRYFLILSLLSITLLISWFIPFTEKIWNNLDITTYKTLHYGLLKTDFSQKFWAIMNARITDNFSQALMLIILVRYTFIASSKLKRSTRARHVIFIILTTVTSVIISKTAQSQLTEYISIKRDSPSIVHGHSVALSTVLPGLENVKDSSRRSFPGDHAMTLFLFALYGLYFIKNHFLKFLPFILAIFFSLPRIISGGHWLTDTLMGSFPIASLFFILWITLAQKLHLITEPEGNLTIKK